MDTQSYHFGPIGGTMIEEEQVEEITEHTPYTGIDRKKALKEEEPEDPFIADPLEEDTPLQEGLIESVPPEHDWQKRYSDLKSYHDRKKNEWVQEQELLSAKLKITERKNLSSTLPKTEEELEEFKKEYPDVYDVVQTVSTLQANAKVQDIEEKLEALKKREQEATVKTAEQELLAIHSDFLELKEDASFLEWLQNQPSNISDGIYKNRTDAKWAARVIDLYKLETNQSKRGRPKKDARTRAAEQVSQTTASAPKDESEGKKIWTVEEITRLKPHEFEKVESEIDAAKREGRIQ